jgi:hypothetical protein
LLSSSTRSPSVLLSASTFHRPPFLLTLEKVVTPHLHHHQSQSLTRPLIAKTFDALQHVRITSPATLTIGRLAAGSKPQGELAEELGSFDLATIFLLGLQSAELVDGIRNTGGLTPEGIAEADIVTTDSTHCVRSFTIRSACETFNVPIIKIRLSSLNRASGMEQGGTLFDSITGAAAARRGVRVNTMAVARRLGLPVGSRVHVFRYLRALHPAKYAIWSIKVCQRQYAQLTCTAEPDGWEGYP